MPQETMTPEHAADYFASIKARAIEIAHAQEFLATAYDFEISTTPHELAGWLNAFSLRLQEFKQLKAAEEVYELAVRAERMPALS